MDKSHHYITETMFSLRGSTEVCLERTVEGCGIKSPDLASVKIAQP